MSQVADAPAVGARPLPLRDRLPAVVRHPRAPEAILAVLSLIALALIMYEGRRTLFYFDDWSIVLTRRGTSLGTFLNPHVGHFSLVPILVFKALFATVGLDPYWPYRATTLIFHLVAVWFLFALARPRFGSWGALVPATLVLFLGAGHEVLLWAWEMSWTISVAAGLGGWLCLRTRTPARNVGACVLLTIAIASSGIGLPFVLGALVALLIPAGQRRRAWVAIVPLAIYLLWLVAWGASHNTAAQGGLQLSNVPDTPLYMVTSAATAAGGVLGLNLEFGRVVLGLALVLVVWRLLADRVSNWLIGALVAAIAFWGLTGLGRADLGLDTASSSRYVYVGAVLIVLVAIYLPLRARVSARAWALILAAVAFAVISGLASFRDYGRDLRNISNGVAPALAAIQIGGNAIPRDNRPELGLAPQIYAGQYRDAVAEFGSPLPDGVKGVISNPNAGDGVDGKLSAAEGLSLVPPGRRGIPAGAPPQVVQTIGGRTSTAGSCLRYTPSGIPAGVDLGVPTGRTLTVSNVGTVPAEVRARRFGPDFPGAALGAVPPHAQRSVSFPADTSPSPWIVRVSPAKPIVACLSR